MLRAHQRIFDRGLKCLDVLVITAAVGIGAATVGSPLVMTTVLGQAAIICLAWAAVSLRTDFYQSRRTSDLAHEFTHLAESWLVALALGSLLVMLVWRAPVYDPIVTFLVGLGGVGLARLSIRLYLRRIRGQGKNTRNVILVGRGRMAHQIAETIHDRPEYGLRIQGSFHLPNETGAPPRGDRMPRSLETVR